MRFSLLALIGFVALAAVGCAALVNANDAWLVAVSTVTFAIVTAAIIVGLLGHGTSRAFAVGVAVASLAFLLLIYFGLANENSGSGHIGTTRALNRVYSAAATEMPGSPTTGPPPVMYYPPAPNAPTGQPAFNTYTLSGGTLTITSLTMPARDYFMQIGQQLWALLIGCLGGVFASWLWRRRAT
jgi:hypothetical protein